MAALGNVLLAWFNARLSWKVVWQSDSDLLDDSDGGVLLHQTRGKDPAVINDCAILTRRRKGLQSRYDPDFARVLLIHLLIQLRVAINTYFAGLSLQRKTYRVQKKKCIKHIIGGSMKVYSLWTRSRCLSWGWIMVTWHRWHIGSIHYFTYNSPRVTWSSLSWRYELSWIRL